MVSVPHGTVIVNDVALCEKITAAKSSNTDIKISFFIILWYLSKFQKKAPAGAINYAIAIAMLVLETIQLVPLLMARVAPPALPSLT